MRHIDTYMQASAVGGGMYLRGTVVQLMNNMTFTGSKAQTGAGLYAGEPVHTGIVLSQALRSCTTCVCGRCQVLFCTRFSMRALPHFVTFSRHYDTPPESTTVGSLSNSAFVSGMATEMGGGLALNSSVVGSLLYDTFLVCEQSWYLGRCASAWHHLKSAPQWTLSLPAAKGGGIAALTSQLTVASSRFVNNTASGDSTTGYAIFSAGGQVTLGVQNVYDPPEKAQAISRRRLFGVLW
jgi:hypothetical protein